MRITIWNKQPVTILRSGEENKKKKQPVPVIVVWGEMKGTACNFDGGVQGKIGHRQHVTLSVVWWGDDMAATDCKFDYGGGETSGTYNL